jgi:hypothetical protein
MGATDKAVHVAPKVYAAICAVQADLAKEGIAKDRRNTSQGAGFNFRGIDDVYNALAPLLSKHGLCILPRITERNVVERQGRSGGALFYTTIRAEFDFVCREDGSLHTVTTYGEAMDSGDKATNKAMSAAYKYACLQAFCIPTEGDNDADATTHEVAPQQPATITKEQAETLQGLLDELGMSAKTFCTKYKLSNLLAMPATWFEKAVAKLEGDIQKVNAQPAEEQA